MKIHQEQLQIPTDGRGFFDLSAQVQAVAQRAGVSQGLLNVFCHHTSASLIVCENADPDVRRDLEVFMGALAPDGDPRYAHIEEGPDDMPSHVRSVLTQTSLTLPVSEGRCALGTWQGIYLWEHRHAPHTRRLTLTVTGLAPHA